MFYKLQLILIFFVLASSCQRGASNELSSGGSDSNEVSSGRSNSNEVSSEQSNSNEVSSGESASNEVTIGKQIWMAENLNVDEFRNGDPIPEAKTNEEWQNMGEQNEAAWCYYDNDPANGIKYGKLYNWYAVADSRGLCPAGWHLPSDGEWTQLTKTLGGDNDTGSKMKSANGWSDGGNGTNSSGLSSLPGGLRSDVGTYYSIGNHGIWWSSTEFSTSSAWFRLLVYSDGNVLRENGLMRNGFSVRCVRDER